jgi:hypothetical protein
MYHEKRENKLNFSLKIQRWSSCVNPNTPTSLSTYYIKYYSGDKTMKIKFSGSEGREVLTIGKLE